MTNKIILSVANNNCLIKLLPCSALREAEEIFGDGFDFDKVQEEMEEEFDEDEEDDVSYNLYNI